MIRDCKYRFYEINYFYLSNLVLKYEKTKKLSKLPCNYANCKSTDKSATV